MRVSNFNILALFFILSVINLFSYSNKQEYEVFLLKKSEELKLWEDPYWHKLLYYRKNILKGYKSQNVKTDFFLSKYGRYSPRSELLRHINGFFYEGDDNDSPECKFPLRYKWLRERLSIDESILPLKNCNDFNEWRKILNPSSISIVFASGYLSNPSTLYGHTFLILRNTDNKNTPLLDYTLNYAASTDDRIGLMYAFKGVSGLYPGRFSTLPYYMKIQEYQNMESRDLWEYPLNLTQTEIDILLMHLWELGKAEFPYYFFSKNCSWQLLPLFDIIRNQSLASQFKLWVIPTDTLKIVVEKFGDNKNFIYRPSLYSKLRNKIKSLSIEEEKAALEIISDTNTLKLIKTKLNDESLYKILDTDVEYLSFLHYSGEIPQDEMDIKMNPLLFEMNKINSTKTYSNNNSQNLVSPIESRNSTSFSFGFEKKNSYNLYAINIRPALGDLLDFNEGYSENSVLEMGRIELRYIKELNKLYIKDFTAVNVMSLNPIDKWFKKTSWGIKFGYSEYERSSLENNIKEKFYIETMRGYSFNNNFIKNSVFYTLGGFSINYVTDTKNNFKPSLELLLGITGSNYKLKYDINFKLISFKNDRGFSSADFGFSFRVTQNSSVKLKYTKTNLYNNYLFLFNLFLLP